MLLLLAVRMKSYQLQALRWMRNREHYETDECFHQPSSSSLSQPNDCIQNGQNLPLQGVCQGDNEIAKGLLIVTCIHTCIYLQKYMYMPSLTYIYIVHRVS